MTNNSNNNNEFGRRLKNLLSEKKLTQKELSEYVGVKPNTVSDWVKKGTSPKVRHIYAMSKFFNVSFDYLFTGKNDINNPLVETLTEDEQELLTYFRKLPQREKHVQIGLMLGESKKYLNEEKNAI